MPKQRRQKGVSNARTSTWGCGPYTHASAQASQSQGCGAPRCKPSNTISPSSQAYPPWQQAISCSGILHLANQHNEMNRVKQVTYRRSFFIHFELWWAHSVMLWSWVNLALQLVWTSGWWCWFRREYNEAFAFCPTSNTQPAPPHMHTILLVALISCCCLV